MLKVRINKAELLDQENIPRLDLFQNLRELEIINRFLGGHRAVLKGVSFFAKQKDNMRFVEIGSGGGDNLRAIHSEYKNSQLAGIDLKSDCSIYAKNNSSGTIQYYTDDFRNLLNYQNTNEVIFNSLFCHHFSNDQLVEMLKWMNENSNLGFFIADLHRHWLAWISIKFLTSLFSKSYLVKNDAPLSVKRGFKRKEWEKLLKKAGIINYEIHWIWAFRFLIVVKK